MSTKTSTSFYLMHRGEQTNWLRENHTFAFLLLTVIAERVRWNENNKSMGLQLMQCVIGTTEKLWVGCTRMQIRVAINTLKCNQLIAIKTTNKGTIITLLNNGIATVNANLIANQTPPQQPTNDSFTATNLKGNKKIEGIDLPLYFADTDVIQALAVELKKADADIKNLATAFVKHCGVLKTTYSANAAFALQRDFKNYAATQQQTNNSPYNVPYGVLYSR